jgi:hypothetical protein
MRHLPKIIEFLATTLSRSLGLPMHPPHVTNRPSMKFVAAGIEVGFRSNADFTFRKKLPIGDLCWTPQPRLSGSKRDVQAEEATGY